MKREKSHMWVAAETGVEQGVPRDGGTYMRPGYKGGLVTFSGPEVQENRCLLSNLACGISCSYQRN